MGTKDEIINEIFYLALKIRKQHKIQGLKFVSLIHSDYSKRSKPELIKIKQELEGMR